MRAPTLRRLLTEEVTITTPAGIDEHGQPTGGTTTTAKARVLRAHRRSVSVEGEEFISTMQVATLTPVNIGDTITVDGNASVVRQIQKATGTRGGATLNEAMLWSPG